MPQRVLDTTVLIKHWHDFPSRGSGVRTRTSMEAWARKLIQDQGTDSIVTPVYIEVVAGVCSDEELRLTQAYLEPFRVIDGKKIPKEDWDEAERIAKRVSRTKRKRQLGDCLIRAIANRLNCDVVSFDTGFPR